MILGNSICLGCGVDYGSQIELLAHVNAGKCVPSPIPHFKDTNPKDAIAGNKPQLHLVPDTINAYASLSFVEGATKYGAYNWRVSGVKASVYKSAAERHLSKYWNGEWSDPVTGVPHLASVIACCGIILDANECNKLTDDRPPPMDIGSLYEDMESNVAHLKELHKDKNPKHYTIVDSIDESFNSV